MLRRATALKRICDRQRVQNATCQRPNEPSLVYKNLRKVLRFVYGFSEIL